MRLGVSDTQVLAGTRIFESLSRFSAMAVDFKGGNLVDPAERGRKLQLLPEVNRRAETLDAVARRARFGAFRVLAK